MKCPICSGTGELPDIELNLSHNRLSYNGRSVKLRGREAEVLHVIINEGPASTDRLIKRVFSGQDLYDPVGNISVNMHRLRGKIKPLGLFIVNIGLRGFSAKASYVLTKGDIK